MRIKKCRQCGFPYWLAKLIRWNKNGTITMLANPDRRAVIIEAGFLTDLFTRIEEHLGLSISHLVFEAQRNAAVHTIDSQLSKFPGYLGRWGFNKRIVVSTLCRLSIWMGTAYVKLIKYRPGRIGEAIIRNPYNRELMAAIILGALESLERRPFQHSWRKEGGDDIISISVAGERPEISERLDMVFPALKPGKSFLPRCPSCGVPRELAYLEWREEEGIIIDTRRDTRMVLLDGYVPTVVFCELARELGEVIYPLIIQAEKDYTHRRIRELGTAGEESGVLPKKERERIYEQALASLPLLGQGNPVNYRYGYEGLEVTVDNPYNEYLLAGHMSALFEAAEGRESEVTWEFPDTSSVTFTVRARE